MNPTGISAIGDRIRSERLRHGLSVRGLAREAGVSPSLVSQIETNKSRPSVSTLYAITTVLGITIADLLDSEVGAELTSAPEIDGSEFSLAAVATGDAEDPQAGPSVAAGMTALLTAAGQKVAGTTTMSAAHGGRTITGPDRERMVGPVVIPAEREMIILDSGVTWERLGQVPGTHVDFLLVTYQPGGTSSSNGELMRHSGAEFGYLISGALTLKLGFEEHSLVAGDAVSFASSTPHGYHNDGTVPAVGLWLVLDRE